MSSTCYSFSLSDISQLSVSGVLVFFFQAEDGIRDLVRSRGLGDVYKRQDDDRRNRKTMSRHIRMGGLDVDIADAAFDDRLADCLLYTSDAADERSSVDLGGRRIIKKNKKVNQSAHTGGNISR